MTQPGLAGGFDGLGNPESQVIDGSAAAGPLASRRSLRNSADSHVEPLYTPNASCHMVYR